MKKSGGKAVRYNKWGYIFLVPFIVVYVIFQLIPLFSTVYYSFFEHYRSGLKIIGPNFVGLENYARLFSADLPKYFGNTMLMWLIGFVPERRGESLPGRLAVYYNPECTRKWAALPAGSWRYLCDGTHAAGVESLIAVLCALVILR